MGENQTNRTNGSPTKVKIQSTKKSITRKDQETERINREKMSYNISNE